MPPDEAALARERQPNAHWKADYKRRLAAIERRLKALEDVDEILNATVGAPGRRPTVRSSGGAAMASAPFPVRAKRDGLLRTSSPASPRRNPNGTLPPRYIAHGFRPT